MDPVHRGNRRVYPNFLRLELCQELLFIQRSLAVVGYRPNVQSLTLYELLLACPQLLPAVAKARQLIWDAVEAQFDAHCQVWPETTSLISWTEGASIGWHYDANRWVPAQRTKHLSTPACCTAVHWQHGAIWERDRATHNSTLQAAGAPCMACMACVVSPGVPGALFCHLRSAPTHIPTLLVEVLLLLAGRTLLLGTSVRLPTSTRRCVCAGHYYCVNKGACQRHHIVGSMMMMLGWFSSPPPAGPMQNYPLLVLMPLPSLLLGAAAAAVVAAVRALILRGAPFASSQALSHCRCPHLLACCCCTQQTTPVYTVWRQ
jgi:hypothetical protein